jgi:Protein of unknown function (DUF3592)
MGSTIIIMSGFLGLIWCFVLISRAIDSQDWKRVDCEIIESRISQRGIGKNIPIVIYKYMVDGLTYEGKTIRFGGMSGFKSTANEFCKKYTKGKIVKVSLDPNNPKRSVLEPGLFANIYVIVSLCAIILVLGLKRIL